MCVPYCLFKAGVVRSNTCFYFSFTNYYRPAIHVKMHITRLCNHIKHFLQISLTFHYTEESFLF